MYKYILGGSIYRGQINELINKLNVKNNYIKRKIEKQFKNLIYKKQCPNLTPWVFQG